MSDTISAECIHVEKLRSRGRVTKFRRTSAETEYIGRNYMIMRHLLKTINENSDQQVRNSVNERQILSQCINLTEARSPCVNVQCDPTAVYRRIDACCNNLNNITLGTPNRPFKRFVPPAYSDGVGLPRGGLIESTLPSARNVSTTIHHGVKENKHPFASLMVMQFGQFLDHDLTLTPEQDLHCCDPHVFTQDIQEPPEARFCYNIDITNDPFFSEIGKYCFPFTRSDSICTSEGVREQFNILSSFIDGGNVYGENIDKATRLREFSGGKMKTHRLGPTLPTRRQGGLTDNPRQLFAGDMRATEQPGLTSMHSLFVNEHNKIADLIAHESSTILSDEEIYQQARQIVIAEIQNIVYGEFLPIVLGPQIMNQYGLQLNEKSQYDPSVDPTVHTEFASAAYRFGHSLVPSNLEVINSPKQRTKVSSCPFKELFHNFEDFVIGSDSSGKAWQNLLNGIANTESNFVSSVFLEPITNFLFCEDCSIETGFGQDLVARNIQRGRDHGIASYIRYREFCELNVPSNWTDKPQNILEEVWDNFQRVYSDVEDIDLFTGGISETPVEGGMVGATFACIIATQFANVKNGDRFFFTHSENGQQNEKGLIHIYLKIFFFYFLLLNRSTIKFEIRNSSE